MVPEILGPSPLARVQKPSNILPRRPSLEHSRTSETALRTALDRHNIALEDAEVGVWVLDLAEASLIWSDSYKALFGLGPDDPISLDRFFELLHPEDRERTREAVERSIREAQPCDIEYHVVWPEASAALAAQEQLFRTLANSIPQLAWMADDQGSTFWYNQRWYDF
ncbi:MAG: PAS domain-containing protein, partial [Acidobacteriaceae bacterium]|nr:PAS domain-containing protein [Acidobacteriaceae bacterium]